MTYLIDIQRACSQPLPLTDQDLEHYAVTALQACCAAGEITLRLVDREEITRLNRSYRQQDKATNVLAFPSCLPDSVILDQPLLGDVIVCPAVLQEESISLQKPLSAHWAHIVIHGVLHLLGYDHHNEEETLIMQGLETRLLDQLGFDDPYA